MGDDEVSIVEPSVPLIDLCTQNVDNAAAHEDACASSFLESIVQKYSGKNKQHPARKGEQKEQDGDIKAKTPSSRETEQTIRTPKKTITTR